MSGGSTTQSSGTSTSVNQIPAWMSDAGQQNYAYAQNVAQQPLQQYQGQMVADTSPQTQQSWDVAANSGNVGADQYNGATAGYLGALGQTPSQVTNPGNATPITAGQLSNTDLSPYMNPYTQDVINATLPGMQQANALSQNQQANAANSANAFGGSRQGIQQGVAQAQGAQNIGLMLANLNNQNFTQAQAAATGDINRNLTAAETTNQKARRRRISRGRTPTCSPTKAPTLPTSTARSRRKRPEPERGAKQDSTRTSVLRRELTNTGDSMSKNERRQLQHAASWPARAQSMQSARNQINAQMAKFNQAFNYPAANSWARSRLRSGMTHHDTSTSEPDDFAVLRRRRIGPRSSPRARARLSDIYGMMPSDKTLKKDITPAGAGPAGIPVFKYRFKGQPSSAPKIAGPMAQDVQKVAPQAVSPDPGFGRQAADPYADARRGDGGNPSIAPPTPQALSPFMPPVGSSQATTAMRAGARGMKGALANTKVRPRIAGGLSG